MVLENITNNAIFIKISSSALGAKWFFEGQYDTFHIVSVQDFVKPNIRKSQYRQVLNHFFLQTVQGVKETTKMNDEKKPLMTRKIHAGLTPR